MVICQWFYGAWIFIQKKNFISVRFISKSKLIKFSGDKKHMRQIKAQNAYSINKMN